MAINYKTVLNILGILLIVLAVAMLPPLAIALSSNEETCVTAFLVAGIGSAILGSVTYFSSRKQKRILKRRDALFIVTISWLTAAIIGSIPLILSGSIPSPIDAFFETCSGFSTTGASIVTDIEALPRSILFWRCFTHWLGGMGILVFAVAVMPALGVSGQALASVEAPGPSLTKVTPKMSDMAKNLYFLYLSFTILETILLMLGGLDLFDSLCHSFSTMGTGGFGTYNDSVAHFNSPYVEVVIGIFMFLAGINFNLYFIVFKNGIKHMFKDGEFKLYLSFALLCLILIAWNLFRSETYDLWTSIRHAMFQEFSLLTTTGFMTSDYIFWPSFAQVILMVAFFTGPSSSSTGGGIKMIRVLVLLKLVKRSIALRIHPKAVVKIKVNDSQLPSEMVSNIASFFFVYVAIIFMGGILISFDGHSMLTNLSASASCLGNIGPGFDMVGPSCNYAFFSPSSKFILSIMMIAGRLEIFPFLMLFSSCFWNPYKS